MAEFCRKCFIKYLHPSQYDIDHIVMSKEPYFCEGCCNIDYYVDYIGDQNNPPTYDELFKDM